jgi:hypothetical protein
MTDINPFEEKKYFIYESRYSSKCLKTMTKSIITSNELNTGDNNYVKSGPFNLLEVQDYLMTEVSKLILKMKLVEHCKRNTKMSQCSGTFKNFSEEYLENVRKGYLSNSSSMPFGNYAYTDSFFETQKTINDKKSICQRYMDIGSLLSTFSQIVSKLDRASIKKIYNDKFNKLVKTYNENRELIEQSQKKMDDLTQAYEVNDSKIQLDSTIYISVLWTILATTTLYYVFKKM